MTKINKMGVVYSSDILIIGGSIAGLTNGIKAKELNPDLDVLVIDKGFVGWSGQSAKAGNGILGRRKEQDLDAFVEYSVKTWGEYLNDQEYLIMHYSNIPDYLDNLIRWGVNVSKNPDGSLKTWPVKNNLWAQVGIELRNTKSLREYALKIGVRLLSYVQFVDLLTDDNGAVVGAVGFDSRNLKFHIFKAKAVALATNGCDFKKMGGMFMGYGTGLGAAYRAGAKMRNAEFSTEVDVVSKATYTPVYGCCNVVHNVLGENISAKYAPDRVEVSPELVMGMYKEVQEGRGPCYADLTIDEPILREIGSVGHDPYDQRIFPDKHHWVETMVGQGIKYSHPMGDKPEVTVRMNLQAECLYVDMEQKTNVEGLWGSGKIAGMGCAYIGFVRGDGLGMAVQSGLRAAESMVKYVEGKEQGALDALQVAELKEKIYEPLNRNTSHKPQEIFKMIEEKAFHIDALLAKSDARIRRVLLDIEAMKPIINELVADDAHTLAKCHEAADCLLSLEFIYRAALMRTESRGGRYRNYRVDFPERDDENWLKWICIQKGNDGEMELYTEDIPMERYKFKPEGWKPKAEVK